MCCTCLSTVTCEYARCSTSALGTFDTTYSTYSPTNQAKHSTALLKGTSSHSVLNSNGSKKGRFIFGNFQIDMLLTIPLNYTVIIRKTIPLKMLYAIFTVDVDVLFKVDLIMKVDKVQYSKNNSFRFQGHLKTAFHFDDITYYQLQNIYLKSAANHKFC